MSRSGSTRRRKPRPDLLADSVPEIEIALPANSGGGRVQIDADLTAQYYAAGVAAAAFVDGIRDKMKEEAEPGSVVRIVSITAEMTHEAIAEKDKTGLVLKRRTDREGETIRYTIRPTIVIERE